MMNKGLPRHLMRTIYRTDATEEEPDYLGSFSDTIPASALDQGEVVNVDWSHRGWVEVTFLQAGQHNGGGNVPYEKVAPSEERVKALAGIMRANLDLQNCYVDADPDLDEVIVDGAVDFLQLARDVIRTEDKWRTPQ